MKISYNWLKEYIDIDLDATTVARYLTNTGLEVEGIDLRNNNKIECKNLGGIR